MVFYRAEDKTQEFVTEKRKEREERPPDSQAGWPLGSQVESASEYWWLIQT